MPFGEPYFSPCLPIIITEPGTYKTRSGETVIIETINPTLKLFTCSGRYSDGTIDHWHRTGRHFPGRETRNDITEYIAS